MSLKQKLLLIFAFITLTGFAMFTMISIDHPDTSKFNPKKPDFAKAAFQPYIINDAIIIPFARGLIDKTEDSIEIRCSAYSTNTRRTKLIVHSYRLEYHADSEWHVIEKQINLSSDFKPYFDNTSINAANLFLFKDSAFKIQTKQVKLWIDVSVDEERRTVFYSMEHKRTKNFTFLYR